MNDIIFTWDDSIYPESFIIFDNGNLRLQLDKDNLLYITNKITGRTFGLEKRFLKTITLHRASFWSSGSLFINWDASVSQSIKQVLADMKILAITNRNDELTGVHLKFKKSENEKVDVFVHILNHNGCLIV